MLAGIPHSDIKRAALTAKRILPTHALLDPDTRAGIEAQDALLAWIVARIACAARVAVPVAMLDAHRSIPPAWWLDAATLGSTAANGLVTLVACGREGVTIGHSDPDAPDHRFVGLDGWGWANISVHEGAHAAHMWLVGLGPAHIALSDPNRVPGAEPEGFGAFAALVHHSMTGQRLPDAYDATRWPLRAPGMQGFLERIAETVAPIAVPPAPAACPCSEAEWLEAQARSWEADMHRLVAERAAAAAWRAQCEDTAA